MGKGAASGECVELGLYGLGPIVATRGAGEAGDQMLLIEPPQAQIKRFSADG